jgi:hypothetical protein
MSGRMVRLVLEYPWRDVPADDRRRGTRALVLRSVANALADSADNDGTGARPGIRTLARRAGVHTATAGTALEALIALGLVELERPTDGRHAARYRLAVDNLQCKGLVRDSESRTNPAESRALARDSEARGLRDSGVAQDVLTSVRPDETAPTSEGRAILAEILAVLATRGRPVARQLVPKDYGLPLLDGRPVVDVEAL